MNQRLHPSIKRRVIVQSFLGFIFCVSQRLVIGRFGEETKRRQADVRYDPWNRTKEERKGARYLVAVSSVHVQRLAGRQQPQDEDGILVTVRTC